MNVNHSQLVTVIEMVIRMRYQIITNNYLLDTKDEMWENSFERKFNFIICFKVSSLYALLRLCNNTLIECLC